MKVMTVTTVRRRSVAEISDSKSIAPRSGDTVVLIDIHSSRGLVGIAPPSTELTSRERVSLLG
jgi:hypothetical protein